MAAPAKTMLGGLLLAGILAGAASASMDDFDSRLAFETRVVVGGGTLAVGSSVKAAENFLECPASAVQHTIRSCTVKAPAGGRVESLGRRVDAATLNVHFQGRLINMSIEFAPGNDADQILSQLKAAFAREPKVQPWADPSHLYASYIWVDGKTEVEVTKTVKGTPGDGKVRMYVSTLLGGFPISPEDQP